MLRETQPEVRRLAVEQLSRLRGPDAARLLLLALGDDDWRVRKEAALVAPSCEPRQLVLHALSGALTERENIGLRNAVVEALIAIGTDSISLAIDAVEHLDADGRKLAVEVLGGVPDLRGVLALVKALEDRDANVRGAAAEALGGAGLAGEDARSLAVAALARGLSSHDRFAKLTALEALSRLGTKLPWEVFEPSANDPLLRRHAVAAAAGSREPRAIRALVEATSDPSSTVARAAILALEETVLVDPTDAAFVALARDLLRALPRGLATARAMATGDEPRDRGAALLVLGLAALPEDIPRLAEALADDENAERAEMALQLVGSDLVEPLFLTVKTTLSAPARSRVFALVPTMTHALGERMREVFREALRETAVDVVTAAVNALATCGEADDVALLVPFTRHPTPRLAAASARALATLAPRFPEASRAIVARIDPSADEAVLGCIVIGALAQEHTTHAADFAFLQRALLHSDPRARRSAVEALGVLRGARAAEAVAFALADKAREVQLAAVRTLGKLAKTAPLIRLVGGARDPELVAAALRALADADVQRAFQSARPLVRDADPVIACAAVDTIGRLDVDLRDEVLFEALDHPDPEVVKIALLQVAVAPDARAVSRLGSCLDHPSWEVRRLAVELLCQETSAASLPLLRGRFEREGDERVREAITAAVSLRPTAPSRAPAPLIVRWPPDSIPRLPKEPSDAGED
jgi:HEAT repeat protein